jgi:hypothetical protein
MGSATGLTSREGGASGGVEGLSSKDSELGADVWLLLILHGGVGREGGRRGGGQPKVFGPGRMDSEAQIWSALPKRAQPHGGR